MYGNRTLANPHGGGNAYADDDGDAVAAAVYNMVAIFI